MDTLPQEGVLPAQQKKSGKSPQVLAAFFLLVLAILGILFFVNRQKILQKVQSPAEVVLPNYELNKPEVVGKRIQTLQALTPEARDTIVKGFEERDWQKAVSENSDFRKFDAYYGVYGSLWSGHLGSWVHAAGRQSNSRNHFEQWTNLSGEHLQRGGSRLARHLRHEYLAARLAHGTGPEPRGHRQVVPAVCGQCV